jgi:hypothetical protein
MPRIVSVTEFGCRCLAGMNSSYHLTPYEEAIEKAETSSPRQILTRGKPLRTGTGLADSASVELVLEKKPGPNHANSFDSLKAFGHIKPSMIPMQTNSTAVPITATALTSSSTTKCLRSMRI